MWMKECARVTDNGSHFSRLWSLLLAAAPWVIIGSLLAMALFIKPQPLGETVTPPAIEARDRFYGIAVSAPAHIWFVGNDGKIVRSIDDGVSWVLQQSGTDQHLQDIAAWDDQRAVAVGNGGIVLITTDAGTNWQTVKAPLSSVANKLIRVKTFNESGAIAVGAMGAVLVSHDYGRSWKRVAEEQDVTRNDVAYNGEAFWVVGEFGSMLVSRDQGLSWEQVQSPVETSLTGVTFHDATHGVAVGLDGVVLLTDDGGNTWKEAPRVTTEHLFSVVASERGWLVVGNKGVILSATDRNTEWHAQRLGLRDLSWHTEIEIRAGKAYLAGANVGIWAAGQWRTF